MKDVTLYSGKTSVFMSYPVSERHLFIKCQNLSVYAMSGL